MLPIAGADAIECAVVGGWKVVVKKGEYRVGDLAVYCEIDSWIPTVLAPFLSKGKEPNEFEGIKGERLRTVKLRGQLSQGLLMPIQAGISEVEWRDLETSHENVEGVDVSDLLNIRKWEKHIIPQLSRDVRPFPEEAFPRTDQERVQNLSDTLPELIEASLEFEVTEKLDGRSMTVYRLNGSFGVCSRNLDLGRDPTDAYWKSVIAIGIEDRMAAQNCDNIAIQGELIGPKMNGNLYKLSDVAFHVFDCYDAAAGKYLDPAARRELVAKLQLNHVPVLENYKMDSCTTIDSLLALAEGESAITKGVEREGVVFKNVDGGITFKAVSNKYLLREK